MHNYFIGIDPGLKGAVAILDHHGKYVDVIDMPVMRKGTKNKQQVNAASLAKYICENYSGSENYSATAYLEDVHAHPKQGVSSVFSLGDSYGAIRGVLASLYIPTHIITPMAWKRFYKLTSDKEQARTKAIQLFPEAPLHLKKHDGRAEALLLAYYGYQTLRDVKLIDFKYCRGVEQYEQKRNRRPLDVPHAAT